MPLCSLDQLLACLQIEETEPGHYTGPNLELPYHRIFGGQLLAQAIVIATRTGASDRGPDKSVKSLHVTFPRQGDLREPVDYHVLHVQDGRTFATRWITGSQSGKPIFTALASLHAPEQGLEHQQDPPQVGSPDDAKATDLSMIPWETRIVGGVDLEARDIGPASLELWQRTPPLPDAPEIHQALLAHSTDLTLIGTALRPHEGLSEADSTERLQTAVTSHTLWFHRPVRMDRWLLLAQQSPVTAGARGFGNGHVYTQEGQLVASFAQESMIRESAAS